MAHLGNTIVNGNLKVLNGAQVNSISGNGSGLTALNASNISSGTLNAARLATSGATAGSYGESADKSPGYAGAFNIPYVTVDTYGRVTAIANKKITLPSADNTDTKNTAGSTNSTSKLFLVGATSQAANPQTYSSSKVYETDGALVATSFSGSGASLTSLNASNISSGTLAAARLATSGVTAGSYGPSADVTGSNNATINVPQITVDTYGRVTAVTNRVYTSVNTDSNTDTKNTAGSTDTSSKIFLVGATSQAANPQTYSHDTAFVDANGRLNSAAPATDANDTTVATTKWVKDRGYTTATGHTHNYAGSSSAGGAATSAAKLNTNAGSATQPVYFSNGVPVATTYALNATVPSGAKFTDTDTKNTAGSTNSTSKLFLIGATSQADNPQTYSHSNVYETNGTLTASSFTGNLNGDNYIQWGGPSIASSVSPADAGCIDDFGHNKAAFWNGLIDVEYTTNRGSSWIDYGLTDDQKWALVTVGGHNVVVGKGTAAANNGGSLTNSNVANYRARITLHTRDVNKNGRFYTAMRKLLLNVSTNGAGGSTVKVTGRTIGNYNNNADTWNDLGSFSVSGWSGWNSIPMNITLGGGSTQTGQYADLRLEFWSTSVSTSYASTLSVLDIRIIGVTNWAVDSFAATGHMYTYDRSKNVTFPAKVTATSFSGALTGNVTGNCSGTATAANKLNTNAGSATQPVYFSNGVPVATTYALNATVPSGAKFTDTTYTGANGISLSGTTFSNSGVRSIATGSTNGTISVNTNGTAADVAVKGLGSAAYTASTAYAAASHGNHVPATQTANNAVFLRNDNTWQTVTPANIGAAASSHTHKYAGSSSAGGAATTALKVQNNPAAGADVDLVYSQMAANDYFRIRTGGTSNAGYAELATADDGNEPIYVRQYSGAFTTAVRTATLLDGSGNTSFPGSLTANSIDATKLSGTIPAACYTDTKYTHPNTVTAGTAGTSSATSGSTIAIPYVTYNANGHITATGTHTHTVTGFAASSHNHTTIVTTGDHRNDATTPASYSNNLIFQGLKTNSKIGSPSSDTYSYLVGLKGWTDSSGGLGHELAFNNSGIMHRIGTSDSAWGAWESLLTSNSTLNAAKLSGLTKAQVTTALGYTPPTTNTTYSAATTSAAGLMSAADKTKLDGIATGANNYTYTLPAATSSVLGGVKTGSNITNSSGTISLTKANVTAALGYTPPTTNTTYSTGTASVSGLTKLYTGTGTNTDGTMTQSAIKTALDGKAASSHGNHVPATQTASNKIFLRNDNTWQTVTPANIGAATSGHNHDSAYLKLTGGTVTGNVTLNGTNGTNYLQLPSGIKLY